MFRQLQMAFVWVVLSVPMLGQNSQQAAQKIGRAPEADHLQEAARSSIFIYDAATRPCEPPPSNTILLPSGSGFVVGLSKREAKQGHWVGWKLLITAEHVIGSRREIILRLNRTDSPSFECFRSPLVRTGPSQNLFLGPEDVDLAAILLPDIAGTDPTVFGYSMILDRSAMANWDVKVGTNIFTVGYLFGYSGMKENYPVTKFGKISIITEEKWYRSAIRNRDEQAYLVELQNAPGLSGAPVMLYGPEFESKPFRFRDLPPYVLGVVKGLLVAPANRQTISQGIAAIEPGHHIRELMKIVADYLKAQGADVELD